MNNKVVTQTAHFAGQKFEYKKELTDLEIKKIALKEKKQTHKGLDGLIDEIDKKKNLNAYVKSKIDWDKKVKDDKLEKELDLNRKDGLLGKKRFIDETNVKLVEMNRAAIKKQRTEK